MANGTPPPTTAIRINSSPREHKVALVVEERAVATKLISSHMSVESYLTRQTVNSRLRDIPGRIKNGYYSLIFLQLPVSWKKEQESSAKESYRVMADWMRLAASSQTPAALFGIRGRRWSHVALDDMTNNRKLHQANIHLCNLGLKLDQTQTQPSALVYHVKSTIPISSAACRCGPMGHKTTDA